MSESPDRGGDGPGPEAGEPPGLEPGDPLREGAPSQPSGYAPPPPAGYAPPAPQSGYPPPQPPPGYVPPAPQSGYPPPQPPPGYASPPSPPAYAPPQPPGYGAPASPPAQAPGAWPPAPPAWQPPAPQPRGPHGQPMLGPYELAGWGSRSGAALLDLVIRYAVALAGAILLAANMTVAGAILLGVGFIGAWLYTPLLTMRAGARNGQTWGKQVSRIRIVRDRHEPIGFGWGLLRQFVVKGLLFYVIGGSFFIPWLLNYLWPLWDESNRALHDMVVSSHVVRAQDAPEPIAGLGG